MTESLRPVEYMEPDPKVRRAALGLALGLVLFGCVVIGWFLPWLETTLLVARAEGRLTVPLGCYLFLALIALLAVPVIWFGAYEARLGGKVQRLEQYPPPGFRVIRRTAVVRGRVARLMGRGQQVIGILLMGCGVALVALAAWGLAALIR